jgi:hypothetical protein
MRELQLVTLKHPTRLSPGNYVVPIEESGLNFTVGVVKEYKEGDPYAKVNVLGEDINCVFLKLQAIKLYLVNKETFSPGDWYYRPAKQKPKKGALFGHYESSIGRINSELDAKLQSLGDNKKIIYKPEFIGLIRADFERFSVEVGDIIPINSAKLHTILENGGKCWVEEQLVDNKVVIHDKLLQ